MQIRLAGSSDAAAIASLHAASWRHAYRGLLPDAVLGADLDANRLQVWEQRMLHADPARQTWLLSDAATPLGFSSLVLAADPVHGHLLDNLHVRADVKGQGLGRRLLKQAASFANSQMPQRPIYLWVLDGNWRAVRFYERLGARYVESTWDDHLPGTRVQDHRYRWPAAADLLTALSAIAD